MNAGRRAEWKGSPVARVEVLRPYVEKTVREYLQIPADQQLVVDDQGDIPIRWGSAVYYVRLLERDPVLVRVFSQLLTKVPKTPELLGELNRINGDIVSARVFWMDDMVVAATELPAETMDAGDLSHACWAVGSLADWADTDLQAKFGGEKALADEGEEAEVAVEV